MVNRIVCYIRQVHNANLVIFIKVYKLKQTNIQGSFHVSNSVKRVIKDTIGKSKYWSYKTSGFFNNDK